jgi:hypothetical protein
LVQTAATAKACYVCYKPSTTVLATIHTIDFLYTCPGHLTDPNFAILLGESSGLGADGSKKSGVSAEEIAKVKEEWEERQRIKAEKAKEKEKKEKEPEEKEKKADDSMDKTSSKTLGSTPSTPAPTHQRYSLHRDYFAMRLAEHRKRRQTARAKELAPRLPGAPRGAVTDSF